MDEERAQRFEEIVNQITKFFDPGYGTKLVDDRAAAIYLFIKDVGEKVEEETPQLKVSEILPVGGFNEGTKIIAADEFDYLVVIGELSQPKAVKIKRDSDTKDGNVKIKLRRKTHRDGKWKPFCEKRYLRCLDEVVNSHTKDSFGRRVMLAIPKLEQNTGRKGIITNHCVTYTYGSTNRQETNYSKGENVGDVAMIRTAEVKDPNILLQFLFNKEEVSTDLCPAIRYSVVEDLFDPKYCFNEKLTRMVINMGSLFLVSKGDFQYRVTYTEIELDYMKNKISKAHKKLYIFLKVIASFFHKFTTPSSYSLKITCIKHDLLCQNSDGNDNLLQCFCEILDDIVQWNEEGKLPSIFDRRLDLLRSIFYFKIRPNYSRDVVAPLYTEIKHLCQNFDTDSPNQLLDQIRSIVKSWDREY